MRAPLCMRLHKTVIDITFNRTDDARVSIERANLKLLIFFSPARTRTHSAIDGGIINLTSSRRVIRRQMLNVRTTYHHR